jgi:DNA-binding XRE family transcriptional regulator
MIESKRNYYFQAYYAHVSSLALLSHNLHPGHTIIALEQGDYCPLLTTNIITITLVRRQSLNAVQNSDINLMQNSKFLTFLFAIIDIF